MIKLGDNYSKVSFWVVHVYNVGYKVSNFVLKQLVRDVKQLL